MRKESDYDGAKKEYERQKKLVQEIALLKKKLDERTEEE